MAATRTVPDDPRLAEAVRRLAGAYEPEAIYLFGSRARGDAREWSDWDLMLVVPDDAPRERRMAEAAYAQLRGLSLPAEIHVYRRSTFERQKHLFGSLPAEVAREGVRLVGG
jgi:predicted nucleotidyltransferase